MPISFCETKVVNENWGAQQECATRPYGWVNLWFFNKDGVG